MPTTLDGLPSKTELFEEATKRLRDERDKQISKLLTQYLFQAPNDDDTPPSSSSQNVQQQKKHILDRYMLRIANDAFSSSAPQTRKEIVELLYNPNRMNAPGLSLRRLFSNFNKLSGRIEVLLRIRDYFMIVFSWDSPSTTLTFLVLYTWGVWYPQLFLIYPIIAIILTVIIPNYLLRHEINKPSFGNGQLIQNLHTMGDPLLLGFLAGGDASEHHSRVQMWKNQKTNLDGTELVSDEELANLDVESDALLEMMTADRHTNEIFQKVVFLAAEKQMKKETDDYVDDVERQADKEDENLKRSMAKLRLLINMKDLQNLTTDFINFLALIEDTVEESCTFKDEKKTTRLFFALSAVVVFLLIIGPYIPWKFIFVVGMWVALLMMHPKRQDCFHSLSKYSLQRYEQYSTQLEHDFPSIKGKLTSSDSSTTATENHEAEENARLLLQNTREADLQKLESVNQVFQIQKLLRRTAYSDVGFSLSTYGPKSHLRLEGNSPEFPPGFDLSHPPQSIWRWFYSYEWEIDDDTLAWCVEQSNGENLLVKDDETWVYDADALFRRRRYVKKITRTHLQRLVTCVTVAVELLFIITFLAFAISWLSFVELLWCGLPLMVLFRNPDRSNPLKLITTKFNFLGSNNATPPDAKDNIIIDEEILHKKVQIFEIQRQDLGFTSSPSHIGHGAIGYYPLGFSTSPYTPSCPRRKLNKKPETTGDLKTVRPPSSHWRFFYKSQWEVDQNCAEWCVEFGVRDEVYVGVGGGETVAAGSAGDIQGGWVYDRDGAYRRRRLTRMVMRTGRRIKT
ncbi:unnamed protein product [Ambrosiozyma monospora]|uniref:Unnamed protein product n=1 Tax=Ambrosiozyma monospora TaxID=43982 RepID=A0ACB5SRZ9_AMBMO|nr:unnamed protein product [Ambrosiozyma monospora]